MQSQHRLRLNERLVEVGAHSPPRILISLPFLFRLFQALVAALLLLKDELQRALQAKHWEQVSHTLYYTMLTASSRVELSRVGR